MMRFKLACFLASVFVLTVAGCSGGSGSSTPTTPTITWAAPASITYGTALSSTQLDATASVAGTFSYSPASGTTLSAGSHTLSVTFTPTDSTHYTSATDSVTLTVTQATPTVTWATPAAITYGTALSATQLDATASTAGTFVYSPAAGQVLSAGSQALSVTFTPTDTTDYVNATGNTTLTVNKATPSITWATPTAIAYGTALSSTQLDATANTPGTFVYSPAAGQVPAVGNQTLSVTFTPTDAADYNTANSSVTLSVGKGTPVITWANPSDIVYGTALGGLQLDATANVPGTFVYSPLSGTVLTAGSQQLSVTFTPTDTTNYQNATSNVTLNVDQATPVITWPTPAAVIQGTALSSTQLDATADVPGTFVYTPTSGTVLNTVGSTQLSVTFTPTDTTDYASATKTVFITVNTNQPAATVDYGTEEQLIRGFGGSTAWLGTLTSQQVTALYDPANGLGLSILRVRIDPTGSSTSANPYATGNWAQEAINGQNVVNTNPNALVIASPWTPPAAMKLGSTSQPFASSCSPSAGYCGGYLDPNHYADYANYLEDFVSYFNSQNTFNLYAISMQNEPDWNTTYESCVWTPAQMDSWIASSASVITSDPYKTKLIMPESLNFNPAQAAPSLNDPNAEPLISIMGGHLYGTSPSYYTQAEQLGKEIWETEHAVCESNCTNTISDALQAAEEVHASMVTGQYNAYIWWWIWDDPADGVTYGLINSNSTTPTPTYYGYALGQYSKFIQPGYYRYNATAKPSTSVYVSAYAGTQGTTQHYVIVAINASTSAIIQPFTIQNATVTSMTPYQTTSAAGLASQSAITVTGNQFTYTLPAQSITTFVQ